MNTTSKVKNNVKVKVSEFGLLEDGRVAMLYEVVNTSGAILKVTNLGAAIVELKVPDRNAQLTDVVLGFDNPVSYFADNPSLGVVIGRYANRIKNGIFSLNGQSYSLATNNPPNHLHGGNVGYDKALWDAETLLTNEGAGVRLSLVSADGEEGYPGQLKLYVSYIFTENNNVIVDYYAQATDDTIINLTQHSYFNLSGHDADSVLNHTLQINADFYTPIDKTLIPTGVILAVNGTAFDFTESKTIGRDINSKHIQLTYGDGFDHNWVLRCSEFEGDLHTAAILSDPQSGRILEVLTDQPGIQVYTGNCFDGSCVGKKGAKYSRHAGVALETQHFPDSPNQPHFPSTTLKAGDEFKSRTVFCFSVEV